MTLYQAMMDLDRNQHVVVQVAGEVVARCATGATVIIVLCALFRRML